MKFISPKNEYLHLETIDKDNCHSLKETIDGSLSILWFESTGSKLRIDGKTIAFKANEVLFLTEFHHVEVIVITSVRFVRFNKSFYCILDHDHDVSCNGLLFFGASEFPVINIPGASINEFNNLWKMFAAEIQLTENFQIDMLQMMLKRYLILCVRLFQCQGNYSADKKEFDIVRSFNLLVEEHFKTKHQLIDYANLLHKSPKTISNIFSKRGAKSPLQYIKDRKILEARRLLSYSDKSIKEISFEIGYEDIQSFSRFFKTQEGISPTEYRMSRE